MRIHRHVWGRWKVIEDAPAVSALEIRQLRRCKICGLSQICTRKNRASE